MEELKQGVQDPRAVPGQKAQLEYLAGLRCAGVPDSAYSDQVRGRVDLRAGLLPFVPCVSALT